MGPKVHLETGRVAVLRLDDPPLNLLSRATTTDLLDALDRLDSEPATRALVVCAAGDRAFSVGADITEFDELFGGVAQGKLLALKHALRRLATLPVATIAAIEHDAFGGGLELTLCCDLRVAAASARLGLPEVGLATMPGSGGTQRLPRLVGVGRAKELILTGALLTAERAERIGLINRVAPDGQAEAVALELAETIAAKGPLAISEAKRAIDRAFDGTLDDGLAAELDASERLFASEDLREGVRAFREKRDADFLGH